MAQGDGIRFLHFSLDVQDLENDAMRLFAEIRPAWRREHMQTKVYSEGCLNTLMRFHVAQDTALQDAIVVRVFGSALPDEVVTRDREFAALQLAQAADCFPPIFAGFDNGMAYQYVPGRTLMAPDLSDPVISSEVARKLSQFHHVDKETVPLVDRKGDSTTCENVYAETFEDAILNMFGSLPDNLKDARINQTLQAYGDTKTGIRSDLEWAFSILDQLELTYSVIHMDLHIKNMVLNANTGAVALLDYEFANLGPALLDLALMFNSGPWLKELGLATAAEVAPEFFFPPEVRSNWLRTYLETQWELEGKDVKKITDDVMERLHVELEFMIAISSLMNIVYTFYFAENSDMADVCAAMAPFYIADWEERKPRLTSLMKRHVELTKSCNSCGLL